MRAAVAVGRSFDERGGQGWPRPRGARSDEKNATRDLPEAEGAKGGCGARTRRPSGTGVGVGDGLNLAYVFEMRLKTIWIYGFFVWPRQARPTGKLARAETFKTCRCLIQKVMLINANNVDF